MRQTKAKVSKSPHHLLLGSLPNLTRYLTYPNKQARTLCKVLPHQHQHQHQDLSQSFPFDYIGRTTVTNAKVISLRYSLLHGGCLGLCMFFWFFQLGICSLIAIVPATPTVSAAYLVVSLPR